MLVPVAPLYRTPLHLQLNYYYCRDPGPIVSPPSIHGQMQTMRLVLGVVVMTKQLLEPAGARDAEWRKMMNCKCERWSKSRRILNVEEKRGRGVRVHLKSL